jgi:hypothetical protein
VVKQGREGIHSFSLIPDTLCGNGTATVTVKLKPAAEPSNTVKLTCVALWKQNVVSKTITLTVAP